MGQRLRLPRIRMDDSMMQHAVRRTITFAIMGAVLSLASVCQLWNGMLEAMKWKMGDKKPEFASGPVVEPMVAPEGAPGGSKSAAAAITKLVPRVTVYRISVP